MRSCSSSAERCRWRGTDKILGELNSGEFVGSSLILSGVTPDVDAVTTEPVRVLRWEVATLEKYLAANPENPERDAAAPRPRSGGKGRAPEQDR